MVEKMSSDLGQNSRASNALMKRNESIQKWKASDTAREKPVRYPDQFKIQFNKGICLLSAVTSGDCDEVSDLLDEGVDINYTNIDGLTALHQACIDENEDMVNLLIEREADIEARDNEGWTPLHAAASAGNVEIAEILCNAGADLSAVNNEGEVPIDLAEEEEMEEYLTDEIEKHNLEMEEARNEEERIMLEDVSSWATVENMESVLDWQGATALHVAAAKGYNKVISLLLQIRNIDVNRQDNDGWTPIHAAVHWGSKTACEMLTDAGGDFEIRNSNGQAPYELAEKDFLKTVDQCRKKSKDILKNNGSTDPGSLVLSAQRAISLLNKLPPFPIVKGSRKGRGSAKTDNDVSNSVESQSESDSEPEQAPPPKKEVPPAKPVEVKPPANPIRTTTPAKKEEPAKQEPPSSRYTSRYKKEEETQNEEESRPRSYQAQSRPTSFQSRVNPPEQKVEPKKEDTSNRFTNLRQATKDEKPEDRTSNLRSTSVKREEEEDSRTTSRRKEETNNATTSIADRLKKRTDEQQNDNRGSTTNTTTTTSFDRLGRPQSATERSTDRFNRESILNRDNNRNDPTSNNRDNHSSSTPSSGIGRPWSNTPSSTATDTSSGGGGDSRELQRELDKTLKEVTEYKQKYERALKEKEELEKQMEQFKDDIEKMQELKNDNLRLKDENGALIRVISKLSRTPAS